MRAHQAVRTVLLSMACGSLFSLLSDAAEKGHPRTSCSSRSRRRESYGGQRHGRTAPNAPAESYWYDVCCT